jgi:maltokinase
VTTPQSSPEQFLGSFLGGARWFQGKGRPFRIESVRRVGEVPHQVPTGPRVAVEIVSVEYADGAAEIERYQLPLAYYAEPQHRLEHALVGQWDDADFGSSYVYDALHDREAMACWLRSFAAASSGDVDASSPLAFHRVPGHDLDLEAHSTLLSAEQSNSSVAYGEDALMKVFRKVTPGVNPDIAIHQVLTEAGSDHVAALYGWLDTVDEEAGGDGVGSVVQLALLQQFLRTASDGWELALASVRNLLAEADLHADEVGGDFAAEAARLGVALAETHVVLAQQFPVGSSDMAELTDAMHQRLDAATAVVPELGEYAKALRATYDAVAALDAVPIQRIHGDLHLGQTLRTVKGWKLVDFEGEPAKPLAERMLPDSIWRDIAGMLRSFDYAAHVVERTVGQSDIEGDEQRAYRAREWSARNCDAFVTAYAGRPLTADEQALLDAYVADKAVYECIYETRNRPTWVDIPLAAIKRLGG